MSPKKLKGKVVLVTAGPTREPIDTVRYISNRSSGKMGYSLAKIAREYGAKVILISGPTFLPEPGDIKIIRVETCREMLEAVVKNIKNADIFIMAGAPGDFMPYKKIRGKIKRACMSLKLKATPDILKTVLRKKIFLKKNLIKIGFAAETESLIPGAEKKLKEKGLDIIIANDVSRSDIGFESDYNEVYIIKKDKTIIKTKRLKKEDIARKIISHILDNGI